MTIAEITAVASRTVNRYWGFLVMIAWGATLFGFGIVRTDSLGLDEGAARSLLMNWSVADRVINPIVALGIPDFRALLFVPLGLYWAGSMVAAKVFTMLLAFGAVALLYRWSRNTADQDTANIASGLLLVSPLLIDQVDSMAAGVFLLLAFGVGAWLDDRFRQKQRPLGGWFFVQLFWVGATMTLHPAGLAYAMTLAWFWSRNPVDHHQRRHMQIGLAVVTLLVLGIRGGWSVTSWFHNPLESLAQVYAFYPIDGSEPNWLLGGILALLLMIVAWSDRKFLAADFIGLMLVIATLIGLLAADMAWALVALTLLLYRGTARLMGLAQRPAAPTAAVRGISFVLVLVVATAFMLADKYRAQAIAGGRLGPQDELIRAIAQEAADPDLPFQAASQWPGRTMIAARRDVFPLPPPAADEQELLKMVRGMTHLIFDHQDPDNRVLNRQLALLPAHTRTVTIEDGGVIVQIIDKDDQPPETESDADADATD